MERWSDRVARMKTPESEMERWLQVELTKRGIRFDIRRAYCIQSIEVDLDIHNPKELPVFVDGEKVHKKRQDKDSLLREMFEKRWKKRSLSITYSGNAKKERQRVLNLILTELGVKE